MRRSILRRLTGGLLAGLFPVERRQCRDMLIGGRGKPGEHVFDVGAGFDAVQPTVGDEGVDVGVAL